MSQDAWDEYALACYRHYPLMAYDWNEHKRRLQLSADVPAELAGAAPYFDVEPIMPEEEEQAVGMAQTPIQTGLF